MRTRESLYFVFVLGLEAGDEDVEIVGLWFNITLSELFEEYSICLN